MEQQTYNSYSTGGFSIEGLKNLANTNGDLRDGWREKEQEEAPKDPAQRVDRPQVKGKRCQNTPEMKAEIIRLKKEEKMPRREIAAKFGLTLRAVEHILYAKPVLLTGEKGRQLTEKETAWLIKHYKHTRNDDIQVKLNICWSALHSLARKYGLTKSKQFMKESQLRAMAKAKESHELNGTFPPKGYTIPRSRECGFQPGHDLWKRMPKKKVKEAREKQRESLGKTLAAEKRRVLYGLEQKTKRKVVAMSREKASLRCNMKRKDGYITDKMHTDVVWYDENTKRNPVREQHARDLGMDVKKI